VGRLSLTLSADSIFDLLLLLMELVNVPSAVILLFVPSVRTYFGAGPAKAG